MALPGVSELAGTFLGSLKASLGISVDTRPLSRWDALAGAISSLSVRTNQIAVEAFDAATLDRSNGSELDAYVSARGPVRRFRAAAARGSCVLARVSAGAGVGTVYAGTEIRCPSSTGRSEIVVVSADTNISSVALSVTVPVTAQSVGKSGVGTATSGLTLTGLPAALFDPLLLPTSVSVAGGAESETDPELRARHIAWSQGRQRGTSAAVLYGALKVNGIKHVVQVSLQDKHSGGVGCVYVGDVNWLSTPALLDEVAKSLEDWRGSGDPISVFGMSQSDVTISSVVTMARPITFYNASDLRAKAVQACVDYFDRRLDPYMFDLVMMRGRIARIHDEVSAVTLTTTPDPPPTNVLSPGYYKANGGSFPSVLTRYRTSAPLITIDVVGPS